MDWIILVVAGVLEVCWAIGLKYTVGLTRPWPTAWTVLAMVLSVGLLGIVMKSLPVGTAYAVWVGSAPSAPPSWASSCSTSRLPCCAC